MTLPKIPLALLALLTLAAPAQARAETPNGLPRAPIPYSRLKAPIRRISPAPATAQAIAPVQQKIDLAKPAMVTPPQDQLPSAELEAYIDGLVLDAMDREHIAGVAVSIVQNNQVLLKKGYGAASLTAQRRVSPDTTLFRVGSISKTFTWLAVLREVEAGRIRINAPINLYLPEALQVKDQGYKTPVSVLNLMDHSAGFEDRALGQLFEKSPTRERSLTDYLRQERPRRVHAPGAISSYSNYGAGLAGEAVSYVTGKPFERLIHDEIFGPLKMDHSTFREPRPWKDGLAEPMAADLARDISEGYRWTGDSFETRPHEYIGHIAPAGSASSTASDMARYMLALLNDGSLDGVTIYGPATVKALKTPIRATPKGINGWRHGFVEVSLPGGHTGFGHPGSTLSFMSNMVLVPDLKLGIFITTNTETGRGLTQRLAPGVLQQFFAPDQVFQRQGNPDLVALKSVYSGRYLGSRRAYGGLEGAVNRLNADLEVRITPDGRLLTSSIGDIQSWVPEGPPGNGHFISTLGMERRVFEIENGRAVRMLTALNTQVFERSPVWSHPRILTLLGGLTGIAALATLGGIPLRRRREFRETGIQGRANMIQTLQAVIWLIGLGFSGAWILKSENPASIMYNWPGISLVTASVCAILAALLTLVSLIILPAVWRGGRRVDSWSFLRKVGYSATVLIYSAFSAILLIWGVLSPWVV